MIFSSPELKAHVSYCHPSSSVVRRVPCAVRKQFTFSTSSQEPLDGFQPNLAQSIPMVSRFKFANKKGVAPIGAPGGGKKG